MNSVSTEYVCEINRPIPNKKKKRLRGKEDFIAAILKIKSKDKFK